MCSTWHVLGINIEALSVFFSKVFMTPPRDITELKNVIRSTHGCESLHVESVPVKEVFDGETAWEGIVEVFELVGHQTARRAYAWVYRDGDQNQTMTILGVSPVDSPQNAVKIAIANKGRA